MALINVMKKIDKARAGLQVPDEEQIVAACTTNPKGMMKRSLAGGLVGGAVGAAIAARIGGGDDDAEAEEGGMAARFVAGQNALVLTDRRLLLVKLSTMTGKPKEIVAEWPRAAVLSIAVEEGKLSYPMTISFSDGSSVVVEGARGTDPRSLAC